MAFSLVQAFRTKPQKYESVPGLYLVIKHPAAESRVLRFLARSVLLALFIVSLPYLGSVLRGSGIDSNNNAEFGTEIDNIGVFSFEIEKSKNNYRIVYLEKSDSSSKIITTESSAGGENEMKSPSRRRLFAYESDAKRAAALKELEDVLLEPPRAASRKSRRYLQRTRYLPDLMGDSLESYPRHVFIDAGVPEKEGGSSSTSWFDRNYPTRNKKFEIFKIETVSTDQEPSLKAPQVGISDWLSNNVKSEDYVVMKAEAEFVEDMMKSKAVRLVDELFLECKPQKSGGMKVAGSGRRAYWQCLALYGQLRDEGVAVHQWWG